MLSYWIKIGYFGILRQFQKLAHVVCYSINNYNQSETYNIGCSFKIIDLERISLVTQ